MKMADIGSCDKSIFQAVEHKSCKNNPFHKQAFGGEDQLNCINKEIVMMDLLLEKLEISDEDDLDELLLEDRENLLVKKTNCPSIPNKETLLFSSPNTTELKDLSKCAAILCSEALQSIPSIFAEVELSTIQLGYENSVSVNNPGEDSMLPLHDSSKFVSALKGSRANKGKPLDRNLRVTWAANVYDPPVTSSSHTVRGHRHRLPKAKTWDYHRQKHMKAKPSNASSSGDRKRSHRRSTSSTFLDARMAGMQALASKSMQIGFRMAKLEALDLAAAPKWSGFTELCR
ncbi:uncharacterized protein LOC110102331 [Dendrobium catenatum]|uniref:Uncharacterized protein n=1 Tax=Dendrobium catenatum TaxID=906689 RepID=A0A2I0VG31_9ASPA|nr:uncharacterized protein LOC110102331 [Dendrobium catenatum]XP_020686309.2 uncharacterized protein LOC110102331 [Dendrobium catenatum]XP_020686317.2 uncharacterized protein LOC110102331 [Dendrobium catenatum]XP_028547519.1 uncharacterized protein LOC110102331 [Dendrobium catenatum]PKU62377.1 hypothetical protein MA16_Dca024049 [Dendrobium catenatum]